MKKLLFHRCVVLAATGAASLALAACGGGGGSDTTPTTNADARAAQKADQASGAATQAPLGAGSVLAADAGAATQDPQ